MTWKLAYTKQARTDAKKLASSGLKPKAQPLLPDNFFIPADADEGQMKVFSQLLALTVSSGSDSLLAF